jgi:hypothetical protein
VLRSLNQQHGYFVFDDYVLFPRPKDLPTLSNPAHQDGHNNLAVLQAL